MKRLRSIVLITPPSSWRVRLGISAVVVGLLVLIPVVALRLYRAAVAQRIGQLALPSSLGVAERLAAARIVRTERRVEDPSITPGEAGAAVATLLAWREGDFHLELLRVPFQSADSLHPAHADTNPIGIAPSLWGERLIPAVRAGLPANALGYLLHAATGRDDAAFARFARAANADILGATIAFPAESSLREWPPFLPIPVLRRVDQAFETWFARAAWQVHEGRLRAADSTLRQAANAAALLIDEGDYHESLAGLVAAKKVVGAMIALAEAGGDTARAVGLRQRLAETDATPLSAALLGVDPSMEELRAALPELMARQDIPRAFQWAYVLPAALHLRFRACVGLDINDEMAEPWYDASRRRLVRTAADSVHWDWLTRPSRPAECPPGERSGG
jgi:hypothetical protein